jgi:hypothetical protein
MKNIIIAIIIAAASFMVAAPASAGSCNYSWQSASDGSSCGGRAADQRRGGGYGNGYGY